MLIMSSPIIFHNRPWSHTHHENSLSDKKEFVHLLSDFSRETGTSIRILALGDSLLKRSLPNSEDFSSMLGAEVDWLHLIRPAARWTDFYPLISEIRLLNPQIIIVHDNLLQVQRNNSTDPSILRRAFVDTRKLAEWFIRNVLANASPHFSPIPMSRRQAFLKRRYLTSIPMSAEGLAFLSVLQSITPSVVIIHLPRSRAVHPGQAQVDWINHLEQQLQKLAIPLVILGQPLPRDHYRGDQGHPNHKGRAVRIEQFKKFVEKQLQ